MQEESEKIVARKTLNGQSNKNQLNEKENGKWLVQELIKLFLK